MKQVLLFFHFQMQDILECSNLHKATQLLEVGWEARRTILGARGVPGQSGAGEAA